jgi:hypothetical protein
MTMWSQRRQKRRRLGEFAPALPAEPAFERPSDEAYARRKDQDPYGRSPTGAWADGRTPPGAPADGAPSFVDPGSYALANHAIPLMESKSLPVGAVGSASADLDRSPGAAGPSSPGPAPGGLAD